MLEENEYNNSSKEFLDQIENISGKGWHGYGPVLKGVDSFLYISFHVAPVKSDLIFELLNLSIIKSKDDFWYLKRTKVNRFYLCSKKLKSKSDELGSFELAVKHIMNSNVDLGIVTAKKLKNLSSILKKIHSNSS